MAKRPLSAAELAQRRHAGPHGGRPRKNAGTKAARRAVEQARELGRAAQPEAAKNLIAGMRGLLPPEIAQQVIACSSQVLTRWGNPPVLKTDEVGKTADTHLHLNLEGAAFPPAKKAAGDSPASDQQ